jgi:glycosyltransferase involved in cell wall biosynthesis
MTSGQKIWFISEVYHPDEQGTAFYTTGLAEGLAEHFPVGVLCDRPTVTARGIRVRRKERRNGVLIQRCGGTTFDKNVFVLRLINMLTFTGAILVRALITVKKGDIVIAVTSPPSAPFIARLVCAVRQAGCILRIEDVYPETLVATGMIGQGSLVNRLLGFLDRLLYRSVDHIVVLGRDMEALVKKKTGGPGKNVRVIRCWADTDVVFPTPRESNALLQELGLQTKFVVSCAGNMGRAQAMESVLEAAALLRTDETVHFLFIGSGTKKDWIEREIDRRGMKNVTLTGQLPRADQINFLNACDISIIPLLPGMTGAGVPSRVYNIMAAGKPIIAVTGEGSEVSLLVRDEGIGWAVAPSAGPEGIVQAIVDGRSDHKRLRKMGYKAHCLARERYSREGVVKEYLELLGEMMPGRKPERADERIWREQKGKRGSEFIAPEAPLIAERTMTAKTLPLGRGRAPGEKKC